MRLSKLPKDPVVRLFHYGWRGDDLKTYAVSIGSSVGAFRGALIGSHILFAVYFFTRSFPQFLTSLLLCDILLLSAAIYLGLQLRDDEGKDFTINPVSGRRSFLNIFIAPFFALPSFLAIFWISPNHLPQSIIIWYLVYTWGNAIVMMLGAMVLSPSTVSILRFFRGPTPHA